jgi:hypothetical protein
VTNLRTLSERQLKAIKENGLHVKLAGDLSDEVGAALDAFAASISAETVHIDEIVQGISGLLRQRTEIKKLVQEIYALGAVGEEELYDALAAWIVDNQLGGGLEWEPKRRPQLN